MNIQVKLAIISILIVIPLTSFAVYGSDSNQQFSKTDSSKLQVISSFSTLHEFAQNVGQKKIDAMLLVPVGVAPHDWEPTIKDVQRMQQSDVVITNGVGFENWVDDLKKTGYKGKIVDTSHGIQVSVFEDDEVHDDHGHESGDPHIWLNPIFAKIQVQNIADVLSKSDPNNQKFYQDNAVHYIKQLDSLDSEIRNGLSNCSSDFITFHDAFSYFAKEYGLTQHTIIPSTNSHGEITARTLENIISNANELNIDVVFSEETVDTRTTEIIANEIDGKVLVLSPLEVISDGTYISKMTENLDNLKETLC